MTLQEVIAGKYKLLELLGSGGWGDVYKGENISLGKPIAIKLLHMHFLRFPDKVERFSREAKAASMLEHPGICRVYDVGNTKSGRPFYVMEYIHGKTLSAIIDERKRLPLKETVEIATKVAQAVSAAHAIGIIHRDVTPGNIIIRPDGQPMLLDFGLAKIPAGADNDRSLTESGATVGSPAYMSPEQCQGQPADARSDIYSLACVVYEMLTGHPPFQSQSMLAVMHSHVNDPVPPFDRALGIPQHVEEAVQTALSKNPMSRQPTMADFGDELASRTSLAERRSAARRNKKIIIAACTAAGILAIAGGGFGYYTWQKQHEPKPQTANVETPSQICQRRVRTLYAKAESQWTHQRYNAAIQTLRQVAELCKSTDCPTEDAAIYLVKCRRFFEDVGLLQIAVPTSRLAIEKLKQVSQPNSAELIDEQLALSRNLAHASLSISFDKSDWGYPLPMYEDEQLLEQIGAELKTTDGLVKQSHTQRIQLGDLAFASTRYQKCVDLDTKEMYYLFGVSQLHNSPTLLFSTLAQSFEFLGKTKECMNVFNEALRHEKTNDYGTDSAMAGIYANIANVKRLTGDYTQAKEYFDKTFTTYGNSPSSTPGKGNSLDLLDAYNLLAGDPTTAYEHYKANWRRGFRILKMNESWKSPFQEQSVFKSAPGVYVAPVTFDKSQLTAIPHLSELDELNLLGADVTNSDIASLGKLPKLKRLSLVCTDITDDIAPQLSHFPNLEELDLSLTNTGTKTARAVARMPHLKLLQVAYTQFKANELRSLAASTSLKRLNISDTALTDKVLENLSSSRSLEQLDLHFAPFTDKGLSALRKMPNLKQIELYRNRVTGTGLGELKQLEAIYFADPISNVDVSSIKNLRKLKVLFVVDMPVTDDMVMSLPTLKDLEEVTLAGTDITDKTLELLPSLPKLKRLNVNHIHMTTAGLNSIAQCKNLEELHIRQNGIHDLAPLSQLPGLKILHVSDNPLTETDMKTLGSLPSLVELYVDRTPVTRLALTAFHDSPTIYRLNVIGIPLTAVEIDGYMKKNNKQGKRSIFYSEDLVPKADSMQLKKEYKVIK